MLEQHCYAVGEFIARPQEQPTGLFIVTEGQVRIYKLAPNGKEHILELVGPGDTFLEASVIGNFPTPAFAQAGQETVCAMLPTIPFRQILTENHELCMQLLASLAIRVKRLVGLLEDIVLRDAVGRIASYLLTIPIKSGDEVKLPTLKRYLAAHLNLTSETLSRTLRRLSDAGLIAMVGTSSVRMLDMEGLRQAAAGSFPQV
jgi:CRP/FNR family transcriptional regulator